MQCCPSLYGFSYANSAQFSPYNPATPFPEIIGEGEVISVILPDGSVQFIFLPITKRLPNCACNDNINSPYWRPNSGVWLVRSFPKQMQQVAAFNQYWQPVNVDPFSKLCFNPNCNLNEPGFQLKFHNDSWTSTTDLHYFYPCIRKYNSPPPICTKESVSVQVEIPIEQKQPSQHSETCNNRCHCVLATTSKFQNTTACSECCHCARCVETKENKCTKSARCKHEYDNVKKQCSDMSIDRQPKETYKRNKSRKKSKTKKKPSKGVKICDSPYTMNKSVATYADEASNCVSDKTHQTKTCRCGPLARVRRITSAPRREVSSPKISNAMEIQSSGRLIGTYETCSCTTSVCDCDTDAESI